MSNMLKKNEGVNIDPIEEKFNMVFTDQQEANWAESKLQVQKWIEKESDKINLSKPVLLVIGDTAGKWNIDSMNEGVLPEYCGDHTGTGLEDDHNHSHMVGTPVVDEKYGLFYELVERGKLKLALRKTMSKGSGSWTWITDYVRYVVRDLYEEVKDKYQIVVNNSFGATNAYNSTIDNLIKEGKEKGIFFISSIGNSGNSAGEMGGFPGISRHGWGVGAIDQSDKIKYYSSKSEHVDIVSYSGVPAYTKEGNLINAEGTSFSSPITAGLVALLLLTGQTSISSFDDDIKSKAKDLGPLDWDDKYGYGKITFESWYSNDEPQDKPVEEPDEPEDKPEEEPDQRRSFILNQLEINRNDLILSWRKSGSKDRKKAYITNVVFDVRAKADSYEQVMQMVSDEFVRIHRSISMQLGKSHNFSHISFYLPRFYEFFMKGVFGDQINVSSVTAKDEETSVVYTYTEGQSQTLDNLDETVTVEFV